jgi:hypothetical protein
MNSPVWSFWNWQRLQRRWLEVGPFSLLTSEARLDMCFDVFEQSGPVVGRRYFHVGFEVSVVTSENAIVGLAQGLLLSLLGQEQCRPGVLVVCQPDPKDVVFVEEHSFYHIS